jgi:TonB family protein
MASSKLFFFSFVLSVTLHSFLFLTFPRSTDFEAPAQRKSNVLVTLVKENHTYEIPVEKMVTIDQEKISGVKQKENQPVPKTEDFNSIIKDYIPPEYPQMAIRKGIQGTVVIRLNVNGKGIVTSVDLVKSSESLLLDQTVLSAAKTWTFKINTPTQLNKKIVFKLD